MADLFSNLAQAAHGMGPLVRPIPAMRYGPPAPLAGDDIPAMREPSGLPELGLPPLIAPGDARVGLPLATLRQMRLSAPAGEAGVLEPVPAELVTDQVESWPEQPAPAADLAAPIFARPPQSDLARFVNDRAADSPPHTPSQAAPPAQGAFALPSVPDEMPQAQPGFPPLLGDRLVGPAPVASGEQRAAAWPGTASSTPHSGDVPQSGVPPDGQTPGAPAAPPAQRVYSEAPSVVPASRTVLEVSDIAPPILASPERLIDRGEARSGSPMRQSEQDVAVRAPASDLDRGSRPPGVPAGPGPAQVAGAAIDAPLAPAVVPPRATPSTGERGTAAPAPWTEDQPASQGDPADAPALAASPAAPAAAMPPDSAPVSLESHSEPPTFDQLLRPIGSNDAGEPRAAAVHAWREPVPPDTPDSGSALRRPPAGAALGSDPAPGAPPIAHSGGKTRLAAPVLPDASDPASINAAPRPPAPHVAAGGESIAENQQTEPLVRPAPAAGPARVPDVQRRAVAESTALVLPASAPSHPVMPAVIVAETPPVPGPTLAVPRPPTAAPEAALGMTVAPHTQAARPHTPGSELPIALGRVAASATDRSSAPSSPAPEVKPTIELPIVPGRVAASAIDRPLVPSSLYAIAPEAILAPGQAMPADTTPPRSAMESRAKPPDPRGSPAEPVGAPASMLDEPLRASAAEARAGSARDRGAPGVRAATGAQHFSENRPAQPQQPATQGAVLPPAGAPRTLLQRAEQPGLLSDIQPPHTAQPSQVAKAARDGASGQPAGRPANAEVIPDPARRSARPAARGQLAEPMPAQSPATAPRLASDPVREPLVEPAVARLRAEAARRDEREVFRPAAPALSSPVPGRNEPPAAPTIRVSIGQVEVRISDPPPAPPRRPARAPAALSLDAYLRGAPEDV